MGRRESRGGCDIRLSLSVVPAHGPRARSHHARRGVSRDRHGNDRRANRDRRRATVGTVEQSAQVESAHVFVSAPLPWAVGVCAGLHAAGSRHVVYVPDNPLSHVLRVLRESYPDVQTTIATREEEAFGIAAGLYLGGKRPTVMLQSSGLGNSINALTSLFVPYQIPALILISMRGDEGEWNSAQVPMGRAVAPICDAIGLSHATATSPETHGRHGGAGRKDGVHDAHGRRVPAAAPIDGAARRVKPAPGSPTMTRMTRLDATRHIAAAFEGDPIVASLGHPAYDLFATGDRDTYFYTWGSMGLASSIGLGLAMAQPDRRVVVLDGDGSLLMNLGSLATIGWVKPANLVVIVVDNRLYGTTGGQDTATAHGADLEAAARAMGIAATATVTHAGRTGSRAVAHDAPKPDRGSSSPRSTNPRRP